MERLDFWFRDYTNLKLKGNKLSPCECLMFLFRFPFASFLIPRFCLLPSEW